MKQKTFLPLLFFKRMGSSSNTVSIIVHLVHRLVILIINTLSIGHACAHWPSSISFTLQKTIVHASILWVYIVKYVLYSFNIFFNF